ncbi:MAG: hypothetical protein ABIJ97_12960 [Bacteroidota bacterium]
MKANYLLPNRFKKIGWVLFIPVAIISLIWTIIPYESNFFNINVFAIINNEILKETEYFIFIKNNIQDEILGILIIVSLIFIAFSKEKNEDEFILKIRLESLVWATYFNYAILLIAIILVYNFAFFWVLVLNMFTVLIFFIIRFNWAIYKSKKSITDEK